MKAFRFLLLLISFASLALANVAESKEMSDETWNSRLLGLMTFNNILGFFMTIALIAFIMFLLGDIVLFLGIQLFLLLFSKNLCYLYGFTISFVTCYNKYELIKDSFLGYFFILQDFSPFFGCLMFAITFFFFYGEHMAKLDDKIKNKSVDTLLLPYFSILAIFSGVNTVYHQDYLLGILTVYAIFAAFGYGMRSFSGGYIFGFQNQDAIQRSFVTSIILVPLFTMLKFGY